MKKLFFITVMAISLSASMDEKNWELYFTNPGSSVKSENNPEEGLIRAIRSCSRFFYGAFYDISSIRIADELIAAKNRGVEVKLVTDTDTYSGAAIDKIISAGIPVVTDDSPGLMHNKFAVIDNCAIYTGSTNATDNCARKNNNNSIFIKSPELAAIYNLEFSEMFDERIFGNRREIGAFSSLTKEYYAKVDNIHINAYFAPEDNVEKIIYNRLKKAKKSIKFMAFSFTSDSIGELIIDKFKEGIAVEGIFESRGCGSEYSEYIKMVIEGLPVIKDHNPHAMHHKVIIIDDSLVITGSFNFSKNANSRNDENVLMIESEEIAAKYNEQFRYLYRGAKK